MHTNIWNAEIYHETVFFQSEILNKIVAETKLNFLEAMEILQSQEIRQLKSLFSNHQSELSKYFDKELSHIDQAKNSFAEDSFLFLRILCCSKGPIFS